MLGDKHPALTGSNTGESGAEIYSANGSHALYAFAGSYTYQSINIVVDSIDLTDPAGGRHGTPRIMLK
ncbi:hypothetical protein [Thalassomonas haliotis]|uniref:Uncharacterized protein n=1 Tax=Thalassomonas haliotis TaxID=485448 RepID=A0ABY7VLX8_9GAMM|nr:hypothetical protein [Thalassomonas haliotis]WDE13943.1 hypothetical protein H3N35_11145 [Thalassomonas haliotis]